VKDKDKHKKKIDSDYYREIFHSIGLVTQLGLTMALNIVILFFVGLWIDRKWNLKGIPIIVFTILGVATGAFSCYKLLQRDGNKK
jgi:F0F1-type ATP synthase assembly protein I